MTFLARRFRPRKGGNLHRQPPRLGPLRPVDLALKKVMRLRRYVLNYMAASNTLLTPASARNQSCNPEQFPQLPTEEAHSDRDFV